MGVEEFTTTVAGRSGRPVATAPNGTLQTDNYEEITTVEDDGTGYPITVDPAFTVQESVVIEVGDVDAEITTTSGTTETVRLHGKPLTLDTIVTDKIVFRDPRGTGSQLTALFIGE